MNNHLDHFLKDYNNKQLLKVISGITNLNVQNIRNIIEAAELSNASYIDIAADKNIISHAKQITNLPICVSVIDHSKVKECIYAGADLIEIGNFNFLYQKEFLVSCKDILHLCDKIRNMIPDINLCVTIPHFFSLQQQVKLAIMLEELGIDMLQTEGYPINHTNNINKTLTHITQTLSSTYALSQYVNIPIITASSLSYLTIPIAQQYGASGIGIGTALYKLNNINAMISYIEDIELNFNQQIYFDFHKLNHLHPILF
uniref:hypothetical protein n=1 Tax=Dixoniella grisea TaxID=35153 RepID=UPI001FCCC613|nr:hypothetical protein MW560_pgp081 [Dixoniella grisea]UNJ17150.1 hypothetical protein [Dixoniella grisea]